MTEIKIYMKPREGGFCLSIKQYSEELEKILGLRTALLAIKLLLHLMMKYRTGQSVPKGTRVYIIRFARLLPWPALMEMFWS